MADQLLFLHLSDIHFRSWSGSAYDEDANLRRGLIRDSARVQSDIGTPSGILVTGDIAFSAGADEYTAARDWLGKLCDKLDVSFAKVWCVPGNHDVDRDVIKNSKILQDFRKALRAANPTELCAEIREYLRDTVAKDVILKPLSKYNDFAAGLNCQITLDRPRWQEDFVLNDTSILRVWGLNSTIVSDHQDKDFKKVVLGEHQLPFSDNGVVNVVMSHHPPEWWRDPDSVADSLEALCRVELFGHKHAQRIKRIENTLVLSAGAVQPEKGEPFWEPRYNWLGLSVSNTGNSREFIVRAYPRVWDKSKSDFVPDSKNCNGNDHRTERLAIEAWKPVADDPESAKGVAGDTASIVGQPATPDTATAKELNPMEPARILTYRFFDLPHVQRIDIACELGLYMDDDEGLQDYELFDRILKRAIELDSLARLWEQVELGHGDGKYMSNPFEQKPN